MKVSNSLEIATSCNINGVVSWQQGKLEEALEHFRRVLEIQEEQAPNSLTIANSYSNIGSLLHDQGRLEEALEQYRRALEIREEKAPNSLDIATSYNNIGLVLMQQGKLDEALKQYGRALEIEEEKAPNSLMIATLSNYIGVVLMQQGKLKEALKQYRCALKIQEEKAPNSLAVANSFSNIAEIYRKVGKRAMSLSYLEMSHSILESQSIVAWHPSLIQCKYELGVLLAEECRFHEALAYATYIINHLPNYKWAYDLKARALTGLGNISEALKIYDEVVLLAPNYSDAHIGRLNVILKLDNVASEAEKLFSEAYKEALAVDTNVGDKVDDEVRELYETESRRNNDVQVPTLPTSDTKDQNALFQQLSDQLSAMSLQFIQMDNKQTSMLRDFRLATDAKLDAQKAAADNNQVQLYQQLERIEQKSDALKTTADNNQVILSFFASGETIPCPKLVMVISEAHIPKDERQPRNIASRVKTLVKSRYYFYFLCQKTRKAVNPDNPMVLELDKNLVKQMAPFIKMSLVAINIASLVTVGISVLPSDLGLSFLDLKLEDVISSFDDEYRNVMKDAEFADPKALEKTFKSLESTDEDIVKKTIELTGKSYRAFSEKALKQKNRECWEPFMKIGVLECGAAWVAK
jgi:tetratricopeptide (TPR) repeat protein